MKRPLQQNVENSELLQIVFNVNGGLKTRNVHRPKGELYNWPPPPHTHTPQTNQQVPYVCKDYHSLSTQIKTWSSQWALASYKCPLCLL